MSKLSVWARRGRERSKQEAARTRFSIKVFRPLPLASAV